MLSSEPINNCRNLSFILTDLAQRSAENVQLVCSSPLINRFLFEGHGYKHILAVTCPKMLAKGITQDQIDKILVKNPATVLSY